MRLFTFQSSDLSKQEIGCVYTTLLCLLAMCLMRVLFCWMAPEVLAGSKGFLSDIKLLITSIFICLVGLYYLHFRNEQTLALCLLIPAFAFLSGLGALPTQYIIFHLGCNYPLIDASLASMDHALGFDWTRYFDWLMAHPILNKVLEYAYDSIWYQPLVLAALFVWKKKIRSFGCLQIALPLSFSLVCVVATFLPALGAYQFHQMTPDHHLGVNLAFTDGMTAPIQWLRQSHLPAVLPNFPDMRVITFPSWHASAAVIFTLAAWTTPSLRWFALILNILLLAATPVQGSHYLSDMIVGAGLGGIAYALAAWVLAPRRILQSNASIGGSDIREPAVIGATRQINA